MFIFIQDVSNKKMVLLMLLLSFIQYEHIHIWQQAHWKEYIQKFEDFMSIL